MKVYLLWRMDLLTCKRELIGIYNSLTTAEGEEINQEIYNKPGELLHLEEFDNVEVKVEK